MNTTGAEIMWQPEKLRTNRALNANFRIMGKLEMNDAPRSPQNARRGRPLPWAIREQIASQRAAGATMRAIAAVTGVALNTVAKYAKRV